MTDPDVARAYDLWATQYDDNDNLTRDLDASVVRAAPLRVRGRDVVELGCGTGKNTRWLAEHAQHVVALDFSAGMLEVARLRIQSPHVQFVHHDVRERWPLDDAAADVVIGNLVLEHVLDLTNIYAEAARVLRPGGQLFLCELHPYKQLAGSRARFTDPETSETVLVTAFRHTCAEYVNSAIASGFALRHLGEWYDDGAVRDGPPRLLSLLFDR